MDLSYDEGKTWHMSNIVSFDHDDTYQGKGIIQPTLWESEPGHVHMLLRSTAGRIFRSDSTDGGKPGVLRIQPIYLIIIVVLI